MYESLFFYLSVLLIVPFVLGALFSKNIVHCCVYLLGVLIGVSGLYLTLGADFVAGAQLLVYVGGIIVLTLFAIMLTGGHEYFNRSFFYQLIPVMGNKKTYGLSFLVVGIFFLTLRSLPQSLIGSGNKMNEPFLFGTTSRIGELLITDYILAFEVVSVLLLGALIAAALLARPAKKNNI